MTEASPPGGPKVHRMEDAKGEAKIKNHDFIAPHLAVRGYSKHDKYGFAHAVVRNGVFVLVPGVYLPVLMNPNQNANTGTLDPRQQGLQMKLAVPQNETLFAKNPWYFANGEAREYYGEMPSNGDADYELSGQRDPKSGKMRHVNDRLGKQNHYARNARSYVDRLMA